MKKLLVLAIVAASCASTKPDLIPMKGTQAPVSHPVKGLVADGCVKPPAALYGAELASCKDDPDMGFCCGYGRTLVLADKTGKMSMACGYIMCRDSCEAEFEISIAMCMPTDPEKAPKGAADETL
jgi:hypothetical protein